MENKIDELRKMTSVSEAQEVKIRIVSMLKIVANILEEVSQETIGDEWALNTLGDEAMGLYPFKLSLDDESQAIKEYANAIEKEINNEQGIKLNDSQKKEYTKYLEEIDLSNQSLFVSYDEEYNAYRIYSHDGYEDFVSKVRILQIMGAKE